MPRVKKSVKSRKRRKRVLEEAKGYRGGAGVSTASPPKLWIARINLPIGTAKLKNGSSDLYGLPGSTLRLAPMI